MKALIYKDWYVISKQLKLFLFLMVVFAIIPKTFTRGFAIMYMSMMPITAIGFDERSKWDQLAVTMPYSVHDLVLSKYAIGLIGSLTTSIIAIVSSFIFTIIFGFGVNIPQEMSLQDSILTVLVVFAAAAVLISINLPIIFKFGAEKGRLIYLVVTAVTVAFAFAVIGLMESMGKYINFSMPIIIIASIIAVLIIVLISIRISEKLYRRR